MTVRESDPVVKSVVGKGLRVPLGKSTRIEIREVDAW